MFWALVMAIICLLWNKHIGNTVRYYSHHDYMCILYIVNLFFSYVLSFSVIVSCQDMSWDIIEAGYGHVAQYGSERRRC